MRIGFISLMNGFPWGGSEQFWFEASRYARLMGWEVFVKTTNWNENNPKQIDLLKLERINVEHFINHSSQDYLISKFRKSYLQKRKLADILNFINKIDLLVISQGGTYHFIDYPDLTDVLESTQKKYVVINHFNYDHKISSWDTILKSKKFFGNACHVFFVSEKNRAVTEHQILYKFPLSSIIRNPINVQNPAPHQYDESTLIKFACVARFEADFKGQDMLIKILSEPKWRERNWILNLYGSGPDEKYIRALVIQSGLEDKILFNGHNTYIEQIWNENHLLVLPSFAEGTPISLVEAFACGKVVVTTNVGGNSEWVINGFNGYIADYPENKSFDNILEKCWQEQNKWPEIGLNAFNTFQKFYSEDPIVSFFNILEKQVLKSS